MMGRRMVIGTMVVAALGLLGTVTAFAVGGHGARHGMMKRFVASMIDEVLDEAQATPEQRVTVHAARDRAFGAIEQHVNDRGARMDEMLTLFEADRMDPAAMQAFRARQEAEHQRIGDAVSQAVVEVHDTLTPAQRKIVTDWIRQHRRWHMSSGSPLRNPLTARPGA